MHLTPTERDRVLLFTVAELARRRLADGVLLNVPEATAIVADAVCEAARRGARHDEALAAGRSALTADQLMPEVPWIVRSVPVEAVFTDGSRLVVVDLPFGPVPDDPAMPGEVVAADRPAAPEPADAVVVEVTNTAPVPISVTSHFHFFESNPRLRFDRAAAYGRHLDVDAGSHIRFTPGTTTEVRLVPIAGDRVVIGFAGLVDGPLDAPGAKDDALHRARACGFLDTGAPDDGAGAWPGGGAPDAPDPDHAVARLIASREAQR